MSNDQSTANDRCPNCGFTYEYDGERCGHCNFGGGEFDRCPRCSTFRGWDGSECTRCSYPGEDTRPQPRIPVHLAPRARSERIDPDNAWMRATIANSRQIKKLRKGVHIGSAFIFINGNNLPGATNSKIAREFGQTESLLRTIPLRGEVKVDAMGLTAHARRLPALTLSCLHSDKSIYDEADRVHLFVYDPSLAGESRTLKAMVGNSEMIRREIDLDEHGCGLVTLCDLPAGEYRVQWLDDYSADPKCEFTVAPHKLVPLNAVLQQHQLDDPYLDVTLGIRSFGMPVHGRARLSLTCEGQPLQREVVDVEQGTTSARFELNSPGPFEVVVQMLDDPSRTATVPIHGSGKRDRATTVFSGLGPRVLGSLLPAAGSQEIRGLHLQGLPNETDMPLHLENVVGRTARLVAKRPIEAVSAIMFKYPRDGAEALKSTHALAAEGRTRMEPGEAIELDVPCPMGVVAVGAFVDGRPWEHWATVVRPSDLNPQIHLPPAPEPEELLEVEIDLGNTDIDADIFLVVKDARLTNTDTPERQLASELKLASGCTPRECKPQSLKEIEPARGRYFRGGARMMMMQASLDSSFDYSIQAGYEPASVDCELSDVDASDAVLSQVVAVGAAAEDDVSVDETPADVTEDGHRADVVYAGLIRARDGRARAVVELGPGVRTYRVDAFVVHDGDWARAQASFDVVQNPYLELQLPPYLAETEGAVGRLIAGASCGRLQVSLTRDGRAVPLVFGGEVLTGDSVVDQSHCELSFLAGAGAYRAVVTDLESGLTRESRTTVHEPGVIGYTAQRLRILSPGETIRRADDPGIETLRVLPGLNSPIKMLTDATANYEHLCCEQTATKMLAACMMYLSAGDDPARRQKASSVFEAGVRREEMMWLPGKGFKGYPNSPDKPDHYWGELAAKRLRLIGVLLTDHVSPDMTALVARARQMGMDAARAYGSPWPIQTPRDAEEAYLAARFSPDDEVVQRALQMARGYGGSIPADRKKRVVIGAVGERCDSAYSAAILLAKGTTADYPRALELANKVVGQLNGQGGLYSTVDSSAALCLMQEIHNAGLVGGQQLKLNGKDATIHDAVVAEHVESVTALDHPVLVRASTRVTERWDQMKGDVGVSLDLVQGDKTVHSVEVTEDFELVIRLNQPYQTGDLAHVFLSASVAQLISGAQVRERSIDFAGKQDLHIPLVATSVSLDAKAQPAPHRFTVFVRNMYEEERVGSPDPLMLQVTPRGERASMAGWPDAVETIRGSFA